MTARRGWQSLYFRLADLRNLDVELIFYNTTSLHFEIDAIDQGHGDEDLAAGSIAAGSKTYRAPRKRGMSKNGRSDAPLRLQTVCPEARVPANP